MVKGLTLDEASGLIGRALDLELDQRRSSFVGRYFLYRDDELELQLKTNWITDGELIHPDIPEGVFLHYSCGNENLLRSILDELTYLEFIRSEPFWRTR